MTEMTNLAVTPAIHLSLGAARSGKSRFAEQQASLLEQRSAATVVYIATAQAHDGEMQQDLVDIPPNIDNRRTGQGVVEVVWSDKITPSLYGNGCRLLESSSMLQSMIHSYSHPVGS